MKKNILFLILIIFVFGAIGFLPATTNASDGSSHLVPRKLEITYPPLPSGTGILPPTTVDTLLPSYVAYIFYFILGASGLIALVVIVIAGFQYVASAGMPEKLNDAKNQIFSALLGLVILFSSFLILNTINPEFVRLPRLPATPPVIPQLAPGVLLCAAQINVTRFWVDRQLVERQTGDAQTQTVERLNRVLKAIRENCYWQRTAGSVPSSFSGKIGEIWLIPDPARNVRYGAILYDKSGFGGKALVVFEPDTGFSSQEPVCIVLPTSFASTPHNGNVALAAGDQGTGSCIRGPSTASVRPFIFNNRPNPDWYTKLYKLIFFNRDNPQEQTSECRTGRGLAKISPDLTQCDVLDPEIGSVEIEGNFIVIFYRESTTTDFENNAIDVFINSDSNLNDNRMGKWKQDCVEQQTTPPRFYPCAGDMAIIAGDIF